MRCYSLPVRRWILGVLATCGVTAAIAVPLLATGSSSLAKPHYRVPTMTPMLDRYVPPPSH